MNISEKHLCEIVANSLPSDKWITFTEVKSGESYRKGVNRFDLVAIRKSWAHPCIRIYEAKSNHHSFINDHKWTKYLPYCNEYYWLCPKGTILTKEIGPKCGLVGVNLNTLKPYTYKKAVFTKIDEKLRSDMIMYLFMWKIGTSEIPTSREETINTIKREMKQDTKLGSLYATFISRKLQEAQEYYESKEREFKERERSLKDFERWSEQFGEIPPWVLKQAITNIWGWKDIKSSNNLSSRINRLTISLNSFIQDLQDLQKVLD